MKKVTIHTLHENTAQEVFDFITNHLLIQNKKAGSIINRNADGFECLYLDPDGNKCAAGCLIPKEDYKKAFEGANWRTCSVLLGTEDHFSLINSLQHIHDDKEVEEWESELKFLADENMLTFNPPNIITKTFKRLWKKMQYKKK